MKTLYLDCRMGASGAKIMGALVDLLENPDKFIYDFNRIGIDGISVRRTPEAIKGISGSQLEFTRTASSKEDPYADEIDDDEPVEKIRVKHVRRNLETVKEMVMGLEVSSRVKEDTIKVYSRIASEAAKVYDKDMNYMTLHRTGSRDVIASVVGVCMLLEMLNPDDIVVSAVSVGSGFTRTTRGRVPVPCAELQRILGNISYTNGEEESEICSLEGAAILSVFAGRSASMPELTNINRGAGFGIRTYKNGVNCVRAYLGENIAIAGDPVTELSACIYNTNDDEIINIKKHMLSLGCIDVYTSIITDCDGSFGYNLRCIVAEEKANTVATEIMDRTAAECVYRTNCGIYRK